MINLHKTMAIVCTWPNYDIDHRMSSFLFNLGLPTFNLVTAKIRGDVTTRRNTVIKNLVLPVIRRYDWFLFIDHDHFPETGAGETFLPFFDEIDADVVGCQYETGNRKSWLTPDVFHMGMVRIRGRVFASLPPPWFKFIYNDHHTRIVKCECEFLRERILEAGFTITNRGKVGHKSNHAWWYSRSEQQ